MKTLIPSLLLLALFSLACEGKNEGPTAVPEIKGTVNDENGNPYPKARVIVSDGVKAHVLITNIEGKYEWDTDLTGAFTVNLTRPLSTQIQGQNPVNITIQTNQTAEVNFSLQTQAVQATLNLGSLDVFGEVKNKDGNIPTLPEEEIYARNVFDPPIGQLNPVKTPTGQAVTLADWQKASGSIKVACDANLATAQINLSGMIPGGTYTLWCNFLNKVKGPGQSINLGADVVKIEPLGSGSSNVVIAKADGSITSSITHPSCLLTAEPGLVIVVIYHLNGKTFGADHIPDEEDVSHMLVYFE